MKSGDIITVICNIQTSRLNFMIKIGQKYRVKYINKSYFQYRNQTFTFKGRTLSFSIIEEEINYNIY